MPHKPTPASVTRIPLASPSSQTIATQHMPTDIKGTRQGMNKTTHHMVKAGTRAKVLLKAAAPRFDKMPSADGIECYNKHSNMIVEHAVEQALTSSSAEMEERGRVSDAFVSIQYGKEGNTSSPLPNATLTLCKAMPVYDLWVPPASPSKDRAPLSSLVIPTLRTMSAVGPRRAMDETARRKLKTHSRASIKVCPWSDEPPSAGLLERFERHSVFAEIGPAVK